MKGFEEEKQSNEIKFFIPTLQQTEIVGRTISADAMHTQRESADYVVSQGAHFHFTVKGNQKNLFDAIETWFEMEAKHQKAAYQEPLDKDHGRITSRKIWMTDKLNDYVEFPHVNLVFAVQRTVKDPNGKMKDSIEIAFGVTSLSKDETSTQEVLRVNRATGLLNQHTGCLTIRMRLMKMPARFAVGMALRTWRACGVSH